MKVKQTNECAINQHVSSKQINFCMSVLVHRQARLPYTEENKGLSSSVTEENR